MKTKHQLNTSVNPPGASTYCLFTCYICCIRLCIFECPVLLINPYFISNFISLTIEETATSFPFKVKSEVSSVKYES